MKRLLLLAGITFLPFFLQAQLPSWLSSSGLVAWYPFNGNANDESGNGNNGKVHSATLAKDRFGNANAAYDFSTNTAKFGQACQWIEIPYNNSLNVSSFTLSAWINADSLFWDGNSIHLSSIMHRGDGGCSPSSPEPFRFMIGENGVYSSVANESSYCSYNGNIQTKSWYFLAMSFSKDTIRQYINGTQVNYCINIPAFQSNNCYNISIGEAWMSNGHWYYFNGRLDDIGIWNRALSKQEIKDLYCHPEPPINTTKKSNLIICSGNSTLLSAKGMGKLGWYSAASGGSYFGKDTNFTTPKLNKTTTFYVQDSTCAASKTRTAITVIVKPPLKAISNLRDTTVCFGQILNFYSKAKGGDSTTYTFSWTLDNTLIETNDSLNLKTRDWFTPSGKSKILKVIVKDNCTLPADTLSKTMAVVESPKADFSHGAACSLSKTDFTFTGTKPPNPVTTKFHWNFNKEDSSSLENPSKQFSAGLKKIILTLTSSLGCIDTISKNVVVKPQSKADFTVDDVCETDSARFINQSQGAENYMWKFGDGQSSTFPSPKHFYAIAGISKTYNVKLVAIIAKGCSDSVSKAITVNANPKSLFSYTINGQWVDFKATQSGNTSYKWKFGNGDSISKKDVLYKYPKLGVYEACLKVYNAAGCYSESCVNVNITVGLPKIEEPNCFKIFPNPNAGQFNIATSVEYESMEIINQIGEMIYITSLQKGLNTFDLNLTPGVYLIRVKDDESCINQKMVVDR